MLIEIAKFFGLVLSFAAYKWYEKYQAKKAKAKELAAKPASFIGDVRNGIENRFDFSRNYGAYWLR